MIDTTLELHTFHCAVAPSDKLMITHNKNAYTTKEGQMPVVEILAHGDQQLEDILIMLTPDDAQRLACALMLHVGKVTS